MNLARLILSAIFIATMLWLWYPYLTTSKITAVSTPEIEVFPDYTADALKQTAFDKQGNISHKVTAKKMELYQELGFTHFAEPTFTFFANNEIWTVSADEGTLYENSNDKKLILEQNVTAINLNKESIIQKITALKIEVNIESSVMTSDQPVTLIGPKLRMQGLGLIAHIKDKQLSLTEHTHTELYNVQK